MEKPKVSYSMLNLYMTCQKAFYYRYVLGLDYEDTSVYAEAGKLFHKTVEVFDTKQDALLNLDTELTDELEPFRSRLEKAITTTYDLLFDTLGISRNLAEFEKEILVDAGDYLLHSFFDVVQNDLVFDWKFSKTNPTHTKHRLQAAFYTRAFELYYGHQPKAIIFVSPETGMRAVFRPEYLQNDIHEVFDVLVPKILHDLKTSPYWPMTGRYQNRCQYCGFKTRCQNEFRQIGS